MSVSERLDHASKWFVQGVNQSRQGDHAGAIQAFDQALQHDPDNAVALGHRCIARYQIGDRPLPISDLITGSKPLPQARKNRGASICAENAAKTSAVTTEAKDSLKWF